MIVVSEHCHPAGLALLGRRQPLHYDPGLHADPGRLREAAASATALVVRNRTRVDEELLAGAPRLAVVGRLGSGLDNVDLEACRRRAVTVVHAGGANARAVAEMTLALMLALARRLVPAHTATAAGSWEREMWTGAELAGRRLGILGFGRIGRLVARLGHCLGMRVLTYHPRLAPDDALRQGGARLVDLDRLLAESDFLTVHLPLTAETAGFLDGERLSRLRRGAFLVNVARGGIVDEEVLVGLLETGHLGGAALDVRAQEPPPRDDLAARLAALPNVILTPHVAAFTGEAQRRVSLTVAGGVLRVLSGRPPEGNGRPRENAPGC